MMRPFAPSSGLLAAGILVQLRALAQAIAAHDTGAPGGRFTEEVVTVSGDSVDRLRIAELEGTARPEGLMLRSTSSLTDARRSGGVRRRFTIVFPQLSFVNNSELPFGTNDGALWAGKGANARVLVGFTASYGPLRLVVIPEWVYSANNRLSIDPNNPKYLPFALLPTRSRFSNPWNVRPYSIDLPWRFGDAAIHKLYPGQSSITLRRRTGGAGRGDRERVVGPGCGIQ